MMEKWQRINLLAFFFFCLTVISFAYFVGSDFLRKQEKPWHMQTNVHEDSLSSTYLATYRILDRYPVEQQICSKEINKVLILVDAWGVPFDESRLGKEFNIFARLPHQFAIHKRLGNRTKHAEHVELRKDSSEAIFIFGGDSLEYGRKEYIPTLGYREQFYCQQCPDSVMIGFLDSLLSESQFNTIAWTTQDSRLGEENKLISLLQKIAELAKKYSSVQFVIQGTHRPTLGAPEKRQENYSHWVPVVVVNP